MKLRRMATSCLFCLLAAATSFTQGGGKAEPKRIQFAAGKSSVTLSGTLSNGQEMEYIFGARKGQTVTIRNTRTSLFDFRVFNEEFDFETEFESSPTLTFEVPETGDYLFFVRKKQVRSPRTARFSLTLAIK
ncbi:MAG: hypothetical protein KBD94_00610 [Pyrinomonadaceae bacterium]|nr:hypothetical protein [Pyrinomonadaceae bacterium]